VGRKIEGTCEQRAVPHGGGDGSDAADAAAERGDGAQRAALPPPRPLPRPPLPGRPPAPGTPPPPSRSRPLRPLVRIGIKLRQRICFLRLESLAGIGPSAVRGFLGKCAFLGFV